ncbi:hypothetical protein SK128_012335 [Halocaridina rubra]|uniref:Uncharacterized protein n=1 Tax=Halocaridina rubra TaxID=373956 RepID=A0AAN8WQD4_HALRR
MPVPVSPCKPISSQDTSPGIPNTPTEMPQDAARIPSVNSESQNREELVDPDVVAGYQDCLKETLRYLLEEEHLAMDHPVVMGLAEHLTRDHAHTELNKLSHELTTSVLAYASSPSVPQDSGDRDGIANSGQTPVSAGYEVTLIEECVEDSDSVTNESVCETEMEECSDSDADCDFSDDYSDTEEAQVTEVIMGDPELRRQLLRLVYQGCDLFASPPIVTEVQPGLVLQL